jgi:hypothetical protein
VLVMVRVWPLASAPIVHGNGVVQAPVLLMKVRFAGVVSATVTPAASDGPLLVTTIV